MSVIDGAFLSLMQELWTIDTHHLNLIQDVKAIKKDYSRALQRYVSATTELALTEAKGELGR